MVIEMIDGEPPYIEHDTLAILNLVLNNGKPKVNNESGVKYTEGLYTFLDKCLALDPMGRASAKELLVDDFIRDFSKSVNVLRPNIDVILSMKTIKSEMTAL